MSRTSCLIAVLSSLVLLGGCRRVPDRENELELLSLKSKCREDGERVRLEWKKTYFQDTFSDEPEYTYNRERRTCLWLGEYSGPSFDRQETAGSSTPKLIRVQTHVRFILDVYTNRTLIEYTEHDGQQIGDVTKAEFERVRKQLFDSL
jgi:hypothetical protein